jgi:type I restriction enzyme, S subunit
MIGGAVSEWREEPLGDVLTLQRGFDLPARDRLDGPFPVVSSSGITGRHAVAKVDPPGVVIGRYGSLGLVHWITEPYWPLNTSLWVKDFKGNDPRYVSYLLRTVNADGSTASAVPGVNRNHLHKLPVRVPSVQAQRRIAAVLVIFDELIAINERRIELLEDFARSLYREWFVRFRFPGNQTAGSVGSAAEPVPTGWKLRPASDLFYVNPRIRPVQSVFAKVTMADVDERVSTVFPSALVTRIAGSKFQRDDVLFARITPCLENGKTALVKFLEPGEVAVGSTEFIVLRGATVGPAFVYCAARSERIREHAIKSMSGSSGRQRVATSCFDSLELVEPSRVVADWFEQLVEPMFEAVFELANYNRRLAATRDLLLPRLVTGQLDISDIDLGDLLPPEAT